MKRLTLAWTAAALLGAAACAAPHAASAATTSCSAKYKAAKTAGTLNGQSYTDFKAANCGTTAPAATAAQSPAAPAATAAVPAPATPAPSKTAVAPAAQGTPVFPSAVDPKYSKLAAGTARMKTCDDQYRANKANGGNAGLKWIAKGGYYSQCSKHLKALPAG